MKAQIGVKSNGSLPVRWVPPTESDSLDEKAKKFLQLLSLGEKTGGWASQLPKGTIEVAHEVDAVRDGTNLEKYIVVANGAYDEVIKELMLSNIMGDNAYQRYMIARRQKVSTKDYIAVLARAEANAKRRDSENVSKADIEAALMASRLTAKQKRAIWDSYGWKTKSPW